MPKSLTEDVLKTIRSYEMISPGDSVMVACSGGPDSVFLLWALSALKNKLKIARLSVCNLDHGLRGKESEDDSRFVKKLARDTGAEFLHKSVNVNNLRRKGISTEEAAREARYGFFLEAAAKAGANVLATGHTIDDQAETVMMRVIKGASLKGLAGISAVSYWKSLRIVRPLLDIEKKEICRRLDSMKLQYRIDSSNLEDIYFRNVVRGEILPYLEKYNPRVKRSLANLAAHLAEDLAFLTDTKRKAKAGVTATAGESSSIPIADLVVQPKAVRKEVLRDMMESAGGEVKKLSFRHWKELDVLITSKKRGNCVDLPGGVRARRCDKSIALHKL